MDRKEILDTANKMVNGSRQDDYGKPERTFDMIADLWSSYLKQRFIRDSLTPQDVAAMMILLKIARVACGHGKSDNWIDIAGYAACGGELDQEMAGVEATQDEGDGEGDA